MGIKTKDAGPDGIATLIEKAGEPPTGDVCMKNHGIILICTKGKAQHEYNGHTFQLQRTTSSSTWHKAC